MNKKGFSLAESVIALSVVTIVSICAITIVISSITSKTKTIQKLNSQNFAYNVVECFKVSSDINEFDSYLDSLTNKDLSYISNSESNSIYSFILEETNYSTVITYSNDNKKLTINITNDKNETIISLEYNK